MVKLLVNNCLVNFCPSLISNKAKITTTGKHCHSIPDKQPCLHGCRCQFLQSTRQPSWQRKAWSTIFPVCDETIVSETVLLWSLSAELVYVLSTPLSPRLLRSQNSEMKRTMMKTSCDFRPRLLRDYRARVRYLRCCHFCRHHHRRRRSIRPRLLVVSSPAVPSLPPPSAAPGAPLETSHIN